MSSACHRHGALLSGGAVHVGRAATPRGRPRSSASGSDDQPLDDEGRRRRSSPAGRPERRRPAAAASRAAPSSVADQIAALVLAEQKARAGRTASGRQLDRDAGAAGHRHLGQRRPAGRRRRGRGRRRRGRPTICAAHEVAVAALDGEVDRRRRAFLAAAESRAGRATGRASPRSRRPARWRGRPGSGASRPPWRRRRSRRRRRSSGVGRIGRPSVSL